jgi:hypothetical protein
MNIKQIYIDIQELENILYNTNNNNDNNNDNNNNKENIKKLIELQKNVYEKFNAITKMGFCNFNIDKSKKECEQWISHDVILNINKDEKNKKELDKILEKLFNLYKAKFDELNNKIKQPDSAILLNDNYINNIITEITKETDDIYNTIFEIYKNYANKLKNLEALRQINKLKDPQSISIWNIQNLLK